MSVSALWTVWCDVPDCDKWIAHEQSVPAARKVAKSYGWVKRRTDDGFKDFCPHHTRGTQPEPGETP